MRPLVTSHLQAALHPLPWGHFAFVPDPGDEVLLVGEIVSDAAEIPVASAWHAAETAVTRRKIGPWY